MSFWLLLLFSLACFVVMTGVWRFSTQKQNSSVYARKLEKPGTAPKMKVDDQAGKLIEMVAAIGKKMDPDSNSAARFFRIACEADTKAFAKSISVLLSEDDSGISDK